jgi:peptide/nickel transport system substrate-binding protein
VTFPIARILATGLLVAAATTPAFAQKSKDTMRIALAEALPVIDSYYSNSNDGSFYYREVYEPLVRYDDGIGKFTPALAKSWKQIDDKTVEFELRDNVKFHNGKLFTADDVVYMNTWRADPKLRITAASRLQWIAKTEKLGPYTVRVISHEPTAPALNLLAANMFYYDSDIHSKLKEKADYGKTPIGTGAIKVTRFDPNSQILHVERFEEFNHGVKPVWKYAEGVPIPDREAQTAHMIAGTIDVMRVANKSQYDDLPKIPNLVGYSRNQLTHLELYLDARDRAKLPALNDVRVRRAIFMAIDRAELAKHIVPGEAHVVDGYCEPVMFACPDFGLKQRPYDPAAARKLLEEAGYKDGFDMEIVTRALSREAGIAVAGMLRKIGIRANVQHVTMGVYRDRRNEGSIQAVVADTPIGNMPDTSNVFRLYFGSHGSSFADDKQMFAWEQEGLTTIDEAKRKAIYQKMSQKLFDDAYILPISSWPDTFVHNKDVKIEKRTWSGSRVSIMDLGWAK